jgi:hypothetical protein
MVIRTQVGIEYSTEENRFVDLLNYIWKIAIDKERLSLEIVKVWIYSALDKIEVTKKYKVDNTRKYFTK